MKRISSFHGERCAHREQDEDREREREAEEENNEQQIKKHNNKKICTTEK